MAKTRWLDHDEPGPDDVKNEILRLLMCLKTGESICPSDAARSFGSKWRQHMPLVRGVVTDMFRDELIDVTQQGIAIDLDERSIDTIKGPIRLSLRRSKQSHESGI